MIARIAKTFGTNDLDWYPTAESALNTLFSLKSRVCHEYAKILIDQIVKRMFRNRSEDEREQLNQLP